jgi:large conductance mechanosensitive channel
MWKDFKQFLLRGNVVDLAVAVIIGAAFNAVVQSMVKDIITPLIAAVGGNPDFSGLKFSLHHSQFMYGDFLNALISFVIMASVVFFFVVRPINDLIALSKRRAKTADPMTRKCPECLSEIPIQATRCAYCTAKSEPGTLPRAQA